MGLNQSQIAILFGVTRQRISQVLDEEYKNKRKVYPQRSKKWLDMKSIGSILSIGGKE